jgi:NADH-quinone oxidoreductase subunit F
MISGFDFIGDVISETDKWLKDHKTTLYGIRDSVISEVKTAQELTLYEGYAQVKNPLLSAPCKTSCPFHIPAQAYIKKVAEGDVEDAFKLITSAGPLQSVCGYVCDHKCEQNCTRGEAGHPVRIRDIKRFVLESGKNLGYMVDNTCEKPNGKRVAVIGSGPAGLANAFFMRKTGYDVTVFEKDTEFGGLPKRAIPRFRLSNGVIGSEIDRLRDMGVEFIAGQCFGADFNIGELKRRGFSAVFLAVGAQTEKKLGIPGEQCEGVYGAIDFMRKAKARIEASDKGILSSACGTEHADAWAGDSVGVDAKAGDSIGVDAWAGDPVGVVGKTVVVIGGGFAAFDAARTALRLGSKTVYIAYRRTRDEMPAGREEIYEAEKEGIKIIYLASPIRINDHTGKVASISFCTQVLSDSDLSGRRGIEAVDGAVFTVACDIVIVAAGQIVERYADIKDANGVFCIRTDCSVILSGDRDAAVDECSVASANSDAVNDKCTVYAGGDAVDDVKYIVYAGGDATGAGSIIQAVADGQKAAYYIDNMLSSGKPILMAPHEFTMSDKNVTLERSGFLRENNVLCLEKCDVNERVAGFDEYTRTLTFEEAVAEAKRCLKCGCGEGCEKCKDICGDFAAGINGPDEIMINKLDCSACGMCFYMCPNKNIEMVNTGNII